MPEAAGECTIRAQPTPFLIPRRRNWDTVYRDTEKLKMTNTILLKSMSNSSQNLPPPSFQLITTNNPITSSLPWTFLDSLSTSLFKCSPPGWLPSAHGPSYKNWLWSLQVPTVLRPKNPVCSHFPTHSSETSSGKSQPHQLVGSTWFIILSETNRKECHD